MEKDCVRLNYFTIYIPNAKHNCIFQIFLLNTRVYKLTFGLRALHFGKKYISLKLCETEIIMKVLTFYNYISLSLNKVFKLRYRIYIQIPDYILLIKILTAFNLQLTCQIFEYFSMNLCIWIIDKAITMPSGNIHKYKIKCVVQVMQNI